MDLLFSLLKKRGQAKKSAKFAWRRLAKYNLSKHMVIVKYQAKNSQS